MLNSPMLRRMLLIFSGFGVFCLLVLGLVSLSIPMTESGVSLLRWRMMSSAAGLLLLGLSLMTHVLRGWIVPLIELTDATRRMSGGAPARAITCRK